MVRACSTQAIPKTKTQFLKYKQICNSAFQSVIYTMSSGGGQRFLRITIFFHSLILKVLNALLNFFKCIYVKIFKKYL